MRSDEEIEAAARAIANKVHESGDYGMTGEDAYASCPTEFIDSARAALDAADAVAWRPIETALKDGENVLLWDEGYKKITIGYWNDDRYAAKPKPYWSYSGFHDVARARSNPPKWWQPLPAPPEAAP